MRLSSFLLSFLISISCWAYVGGPSYDLSEDPRLRELNRERSLALRSFELASDKLDDQQVVVGQLSRDLRSIQSQLLKFESDKVLLERQKETLENSKDPLEEEKRTLNFEISKLETQIERLEERVQDLKIRVDELKDRVAKAQIRVDEAIINLQEKMQKCLETSTQAICNADSIIISAKERVSKSEEILKSSKDRLDQTTSDLSQKESEISSSKSSLSANESRLSVVKRELEQLAPKIVQIERELTAIKTKIAESKREEVQVQTRLTHATQKLDLYQREENEARRELERIELRIDSYTRELIARVNQVNSDGASDGRSDGSREGQKLANDLGKFHGEKDGRESGLTQGEADGRERDYNDGYKEAYPRGLAQGQVDGTSVGTKDGTDAGNRAAGKRDGTAKGIELAIASDASKKGTKAGVDAGFARSVREGKVAGFSIGKAQAIKIYEEDTPIDILQASGTFSKSIPSYPGSSNIFYDPNDNFNSPTLVDAYLDGYNYRYVEYSRSVYYELINQIYSSSYDQAYSIAYDQTYNTFYSDSYRRGQGVGFQNGYDKAYSEYYEIYFNQYKQKFYSSPDKSSNEYKSSFEQYKQSAYASKYQEIYNEYYDFYELKTFNENIEEQTEKYRKIRKKEVIAVYNSNTVLKYNDSSISDQGISGVAKLDGIYQPKETIHTKMTITNFGKKTAKNIKLIIKNLHSNNSRSFVLPSIPGSSKLIISKAGKIEVTKNDGEKFNFTLDSDFKPTGEKEIVQKYFHKTNSPFSNLRKSVDVKYPMILSDLSLKSTLVTFFENSLTAKVLNQSNRPYSNNLTLKLSIPGHNQIISSQFESINSIETTKTFLGAKLLIDSLEHSLVDLNFTLELSKNDILLAKKDVYLKDMAKIAFNPSDTKKQIVFGNSNRSSYDNLKEVVESLGGLEKVNIIDMSLDKSFWSDIVFKNKVIFINRYASDVADIMYLKKRVKNSFFFFNISSTYKNDAVSKFKSDKSDNLKEAYYIDYTTPEFNLKNIMGVLIDSKAKNILDLTYFSFGDITRFIDESKHFSTYTMDRKELVLTAQKKGLSKVDSIVHFNTIENRTKLEMHLFNYMYYLTKVLKDKKNKHWAKYLKNNEDSLLKLFGDKKFMKKGNTKLSVFMKDFKKNLKKYFKSANLLEPKWYFWTIWKLKAQVRRIRSIKT